MDDSKSGVRKVGKRSQPQQSQPDFFDQFGNNYYQQQPQTPQLFEDVSGYNQGQYDAYAGQRGFASGGYMPGHPPQHYPPTPQAPYSGYNHPPPLQQQQPPQQFMGANLMNAQFMDVGSTIVQNQMAAAANYYSAEVVAKSKSWIGNTLKYYFAVDTSYVLKKLLMIFFPFSQKNWAVKYSPTELVAPKDDVNAPDLYIPAMAFVTYVLVSGYLLGIRDRFSPEQLGMQASSALAWLVVEVLFSMVSLYLMSINSVLGFFHLLAFSSYKFVCMIGALLASLVFQQLGYYLVLGYSTISLCFFLMRSLHVAIQTSLTATDPNGAMNNVSQSSSTRNGLYLVLIICTMQPLMMWGLTRHLFLESV